MNTKITFYCTHFQSGSFKKEVFETIVQGKLKVYQHFLNDQLIDKLFNKFGFDLCFDWVVINSEETESDCFEPIIVESIDGDLIFDKNIILGIKDKIVENFSELIALKDETIELLKKQINILNKIRSLDDDKIKRLENQIKESTPTKKDYKSCWIDKSGKIYYVGFAGHEEFASNWFFKNKPEEAKRKGQYFYEMLGDLGWIRVMGWTNPVSFVITKNPTVKQKQALREYCFAETVPYKDYPEILKS